MNHSLHDVFQYSGGLGLKFGAGRVGAGRVDAVRSATAELVAYGLDERGLVSVNFDGEVAGTVQRTRTVIVVNHGSTDAHLALGLVPSVDAPGVSFSILGSSTLTVPADGFATFGVSMTADASQMDFSADPTVAATQGGTRAVPPLRGSGLPDLHRERHRPRAQQRRPADAAAALRGAAAGLGHRGDRPDRRPAGRRPAPAPSRSRARASAPAP